MAATQVVTVLSTPVEPVYVTNTATVVATLEVSTVDIGNFPATQDVLVTNVATVMGTVDVGNFPATQDVTVTSIATVTQQAVSYAFVQTGIATIKATAGTLYQAVMAGVATAGTVILLNSVATIAVIVMVANDTRQAPFGPGVAFGTLIATVVGTVNLTVVYQ